jgi:hypothetical protein
MKIFEQEFEKAGNNKKRILFSVGFEEVELLHALIVKAKSVYPEITAEDISRVSRMGNMARALAFYLGKKQPSLPKTSDFPCPICSRKLRGEEAVKLHLKDVHPDIKNI